MRLGWYVRLCLILSLWWLPIGTYWFEHRDEHERTGLVYSSADLCYRAVYNVPIDKFNTAWRRCYDSSKAGFERVSAAEGNMWQLAFSFALACCVIGWLAALLLYWSARFVLAGKNASKPK